MRNGITFNEVLESIEKLSFDEQETLIEVLHRRLIEHRRSVLAQEIQDANDEFREGSSKPAAPSEIIKDILS